MRRHRRPKALLLGGASYSYLKGYLIFEIALPGGARSSPSAPQSRIPADGTSLPTMPSTTISAVLRLSWTVTARIGAVTVHDHERGHRACGWWGVSGQSGDVGDVAGV